MFAWLVGNPDKPPILLAFRSSKTYIIITVASAIFTDIFVYGIIVPVLPFALVERAHIQPSRIQTWISIFLAVYGAALLVAAPFFGWLADRMTSRRWPMLLGLVALAGATAMLCVGSSIAVLAIGRVLQGISAAVVWVVGLALLVDTVGTEEVGQAMGYVGLSLNLALLLAPLLGGVVFAESGYYAVFAMAFGLMALDVFLRLTMVEKKVAARWLPAAREQTMRVELQKQGKSAQVIEGDIEMQSIPIDATDSSKQGEPTSSIPPLQHSTSNTAPAAAGDEPLSPTASAPGEALPENTPTLLKKIVSNLPPFIFLCASRRVLSAIWANIIQASLLTSFDALLPLFVRDTFHWNATGAGLIFLPVVVASFAGPVIGILSDRHGSRWFATAGFALACPLLILLRLITHDSLDQKVLMCALLTLIGVCLTLSFTPMMAEITYAVDAKAQRRPPGYFGKNGAYAQAYSLFNIAWAAGTMIGPLLAGMINQSKGWGTTTLILGCLSLFTALPTAFWTGGSLRKRRLVRREERARRDREEGQSIGDSDAQDEAEGVGGGNAQQD